MKRFFLTVVFSICVLCGASFADSTESILFLIPSQPGGGWDTTAREAGSTLVQTGMIKNATYKNLKGSGGYVAMLDFISNPKEYKNAMMVQSTPLIFRNISGVYEKSYRSLRPVCVLIAEYQVIVVAADSPYKSVSDIITTLKKNKNAIIFGGSSRMSLDHITAAMIAKSGGIEPKNLRYGVNKIGMSGVKSILKGHGIAYITGFGEILSSVKSGKVRVLGVTSEKRIPGSDVPTLKEQGYDVVFANWRGFFAHQDMPDKRYMLYRNLLITMSKSKEWQNVCSKYSWNPLLKTDEALLRFLNDQEKKLREVVTQLGLPPR